MRICLSLTGCNLITKLRMKRYAMIHLALCVICTYNGYKKYWHVPSFPNEEFFLLNYTFYFYCIEFFRTHESAIKWYEIWYIYILQIFKIFINQYVRRHLLCLLCTQEYVREHFIFGWFNFLNSESKKKDLLWSDRKLIKLFEAVASNIGTLHRFLCIYRKFKGAKHTECA